MSPEQKQAAMQKLVDEAASLKKRWRDADQQRSGVKASLDNLTANCDRLLAEAGVVEEMLKVIEAVETGDPSAPAQPPAGEPEPATPAKKTRG